MFNEDVGCFMSLTSYYIMNKIHDFIKLLKHYFLLLNLAVIHAYRERPVTGNRILS